MNLSYKLDWVPPGGMPEANESPAAAARREIKEELGLDIRVGRLLAVDWVSPHGPRDNSLMFIFDGGTLSGPVTPWTMSWMRCAFSLRTKPGNYSGHMSGHGCVRHWRATGTGSRDSVRRCTTHELAVPSHLTPIRARSRTC
ncbi:NUDIX domain-containing protein [Nonomuraea sp. NPDC049646]|uniref:NUDIX domain-containing protein n=1 Tax=unclassified Nonomuraea TaxID=2593643 RepID=UPI0037912572